MPWLEVKGAGVIPGIGQAAARRALGFRIGPGRYRALAAYSAYYNPATTLGMDLTGKLKLPTADESKGLGTGRPDFAFLVDLYRTFDRVTGFGGSDTT